MSSKISILLQPRWWFFFSQRRVVSVRLRSRLAKLLSNARPQFHKSDRSEKPCADLENLGIHRLGKVLHSAEVAELVEYLKAQAVFDPYHKAKQTFLPLSEDRPLDTHVAHHLPQDIAGAPLLVRVANDPYILEIAARFLGCKPTIGYMTAWWSYPTDIGPQHAENFHRDVDDLKFLKLFVYLTDVRSGSGPHIYVTRSSASSKLRKIRRFSDEEVIAVYGEGNLLTMTGKAGEAFLEDTSGIHKGQAVEKGCRLVFQVVYSLVPLPYAPQNAVASHPLELSVDPWINRVYLS